MTAQTIAFVLLGVVHLVVIFGFVLLERRQPAATLAWIMALLFLPGLGVVLYLVFGRRRAIRARRTAVAVAGRIRPVMERHDVQRKLAADHGPMDERTAALVKLGLVETPLSASAGNAVAILVNAAATYRAIISAVEAARDHIHVQFYIIQNDRTGRALRDRLAVRARLGIEVRVLCDAVGSYGLPRDFWDDLTRAGGSAAYYSPVNPLTRLRRRDRIDFRNHRKIVVIDGSIGFTGGINVGSEYLGLDPDIGHWRDTHIRVEGPAVLTLQQTFVEDWCDATGRILDDARYYPPAPRASPGDALVQVITSGPDHRWSPIHRLYGQAISLARRRVWVTSPYFVPDAVIEEALVTAALRGVDVRLLLPRRSDSALVTLASRGYYPRLLEAGVRIFEYARGFVHAKTMVVDDWVGTIGSANMDIRSFQLNFELNLFCYARAFTDELGGQFLDDLRQAEEVPPGSQERLGYPMRLLRAFARLLSPLL